MISNERINLQTELANIQQQNNQSVKLLQANGIVVDTSQWLTIKRYAEKYCVSQQVVVNWLGRGVIPADCTMTLPEINDIRLIKDQSYK